MPLYRQPKTYTGTTNQVIVTGTVLSTPQDIATISTPQFGKLGLGQAADSTATLALTQTGFGTTSTDGLIIQNNSGSVQNSPRIRLSGRNSTPGTTDWIIENSAAVTNQEMLVFSAQHEGAGYVPIVNFVYNGGINQNSALVFNSPVGKNANMIYQAGAVNKWYFQNDGSTDNYRVLNSDANANALVMAFTQAGNVGIGAIPLSKFHVNTGTDQNLLIQPHVALSAGVTFQAVNDANSAAVPFEFRASQMQFSTAGSNRLAIDNSGNVQMAHYGAGLATFDSSGNITSVNTTLTASTYTPTSTNVTNITSSTPNNTTYSRVGNIVTVYGTITVTETLAVASQVDVSLPIASNLAAATDLNGLGNSDASVANNIVIKGDATNDRASIYFTALSVGGNGIIYYSYQYKVI